MLNSHKCSTYSRFKQDVQFVKSDIIVISVHLNTGGAYKRKSSLGRFWLVSNYQAKMADTFFNSTMSRENNLNYHDMLHFNIGYNLGYD